MRTLADTTIWEVPIKGGGTRTGTETELDKLFRGADWRKVARQVRAKDTRDTTYDSQIIEQDMDLQDDPHPNRLPSSSRRYYMPDIQGDVRIKEHKKPLDIPPRRSATTTQDVPAARQRARRRPHWLLIAGLTTMFVVLLIWTGIAIHDKWVSTMDDWTYTSSFRTFSIDQAVGHNGDSATRPSHFIVQNDHTKIVIVEFPADDPGKAIVYYGPSLLGAGQDRTPVTISFQPDLQTGRIDLVLHVEGSAYVFTNNGSKFVAPPL